MFNLFTSLFLFVSLISCGQTNTTAEDIVHKQDSIVYIQKSIRFIKEVMWKEMSDTQFILSSKPFDFTYFECTEEFLLDTNFLSKDERNLFKDKQYPHIFQWTKELFTNAKLINGDTINAIFVNRLKRWEYFYTHIGNAFHTFSVPVFLRNDTYCLFYSDISCGNLCGEGKLILYKKEHNSWVAIKTYCNWIS